MATVALGACTHEAVRSSASDPTAGVEASADESRPPPNAGPLRAEHRRADHGDRLLLRTHPCDRQWIRPRRSVHWR
jgi:hypothetical protein